MGIEKTVSPTVALLTVTIIASIWYWIKKKQPCFNVPPGLRGWPIIGKMTENDPLLDHQIKAKESQRFANKIHATKIYTVAHIEQMIPIVFGGGERSIGVMRALWLDADKMKKEINQLQNMVAELAERRTMEQSEQLENVNQNTVDETNDSVADRNASGNILQPSSPGSDQRGLLLESEGMEASAESEMAYYGNFSQSATVTNRLEPSGLSANKRRDEDREKFRAFLQELSGKIPSKVWQPLGRCLGFQDTELSHISADVTLDLKETIYQMLLSWKRKKGKDATYQSLGEALLKCGEKDLHDELFTVDAEASLEIGSLHSEHEAVLYGEGLSGVHQSEEQKRQDWEEKLKLKDDIQQMKDTVKRLDLLIEEQKRQDWEEKQKLKDDIQQMKDAVKRLETEFENLKKLLDNLAEKKKSLDDIVELSFLKKLVGSILPQDWRNLGWELGLEDSELDEIVSTYKNHKDRVHRILMNWRMRKGYDATYRSLGQALKDIGRKDLCDEYMAQQEDSEPTVESPKRNELSPANKDGDVVSDEFIQIISREIGSKKWKQLGRQLSLSEPVIDGVQTDEGYMETVYQMLREWKMRKGKGATYCLLRQALEGIDRKDLCDEYM